MGIEQICNTIVNFFKNIRPPFPQISRLLLVCSMARRPGLSVIQSAANVVKDLNKLGIPTGPMPNGSPNLTVAFVFGNIKEIHRSIKKDMSIQVGLKPGSLHINMGTNMSAGEGYGGAF